MQPSHHTSGAALMRFIIPSLGLQLRHSIVQLILNIPQRGELFFIHLLMISVCSFVGPPLLPPQPRQTF